MNWTRYHLQGACDNSKIFGLTRIIIDGILGFNNLVPSLVAQWQNYVVVHGHEQLQHKLNYYVFCLFFWNFISPLIENSQLQKNHMLKFKFCYDIPNLKEVRYINWITLQNLIDFWIMTSKVDAKGLRPNAWIQR